MGNTIRDIKDLKEHAIKTSSKGFKYYMKNVLLVILLAIGVYMIGNPELLFDPTSFFEHINNNTIWSAFLVFLLAGGIYQIGKSLSAENRTAETTKAYKKVIEDERKAKEKNHDFLVNRRFEATSLISKELKDMIITLGADRVTICEMHNGTNSLVGLPFVFLSMSAEEVSPGFDYVSDEFRDFNLSKFPFIANHFKEGSWIGTVKEIEKEDAYFAAKLKLTEASTIAMMMLRGKNAPIGFLTVAFNEGNKEIPSKGKIIAEMAQKSQVISTILDEQLSDE